MSRSGLRKVAFPLSAVVMAILLMVLRSDDPAARLVRRVDSPRSFMDRLGTRAEACLAGLIQSGGGAYLASLVPGEETPGVAGVTIGSRAGDIITLKATPEGLRAFAALPSVLQIESSKPLQFLSDVSTGATIGARGTVSGDSYTYQAVAGEVVTIIAHGEGAVDTDLTAVPGGLVVSANGGPGPDASATGTIAASGPQTITVTGAPYTLVIHSSRAIAVSDLAGPNAAFILGTGASVVRSTDAVNGSGIAIGIIDTGIDITNPDFQSAPNVTRILSIWDQTIGRAVGELFPPGFNYGAEYNELQVNNHLNGSLPNYIRHVDSSGHGTAMAGVAAGDGSNGATFTGAAPGARLIVVKTFGTTASLIDALSYVKTKAQSLNMPCVVALGLGNHDGPHDGTGLLDQAIDALTAGNNLIVVVAAGNTGAATDNNHEQVTLAPFTSQRIQYVPDVGSVSSLDTANHVVISEVAVGPNEFLELYNPTDRAVDVGLWSVGRQDFDSTVFPLIIAANIPLGTFIAPFSYYLIGQPPVVQADLPIPLGLFVGSGHVMIFDGGTEIDRVGYGGADSPEGTSTAPGIAAGGASIERKPGNSDPTGGNGTDSNDNGADFALRVPVPLPPVDPQNSQSALERVKFGHIIDMWADGNDLYAVKADEAGGPFLVGADPGTTGTTELFDVSNNKIGLYTIENAIDSPSNGATHIRVTLTHTAGPPGLPANWGITVIRMGGSGSGRVDLYAATDIGIFNPIIITPNADGSIPGTVAQPGTATSAITVGAYISKFRWDSLPGTTLQEQPEGVGLIAGQPRMGNLATFSSRGPTRDGRIKPDLTAPGAWVAASRSAGFPGYLPAMIDAGNTNYVYWGVAPITGGVSFQGGTSFSAAQVAGLVALLLEKNAALDNQTAMRNLLEVSAGTDSQTDNLGALPNSSWGFGKVNGLALSGVTSQATFLVAHNFSCPFLNLSTNGDRSPTLLLLGLTGAVALALSFFRSQLHGSFRS